MTETRQNLSGVAQRPAPAEEPQAVLTPITEAAIFLVLTVESGSEAELRDLLADVSGIRRASALICGIAPSAVPVPRPYIP
jgi:hypothetical protein